MAIADLSFKLYTDVNLTTPYSGTTTLTHQTDLSDNPQDLQLWYGSTEASNQLEATSNPGVDDITLTPTAILPIWIATTVYTVGQSRTPTTPNGFRYTVTVAGTSGGSEPTWPTSGLGTTVADGTVTWELTSIAHPVTEIKLAATSGGLGAATPGAAFVLGTTLLSGVGNAVEVNMRVTNTIVTVGTNVNYAEIDPFFANAIEETAQ